MTHTPLLLLLLHYYYYNLKILQLSINFILIKLLLFYLYFVILKNFYFSFYVSCLKLFKCVVCFLKNVYLIISLFNFFLINSSYVNFHKFVNSQTNLNFFICINVKLIYWGSILFYDKMFFAFTFETNIIFIILLINQNTLHCLIEKYTLFEWPFV